MISQGAQSQQGITMAGRFFPVTSFQSVKTGYILLRGTNSDTATARLYGGIMDAQSQGTGVSFQVPASTSLRIEAIRITAISGAGSFCALLYGDTSILVGGTGTAPTNPVYDGVTVVSQLSCTGAIGTQQEVLSGFVIPTGKFLSLRSAGGVIVEALGYLF